MQINVIIIVSQNVNVIQQNLLYGPILVTFYQCFRGHSLDTTKYRKYQIMRVSYDTAQVVANSNNYVHILGSNVT